MPAVVRAAAVFVFVAVFFAPSPVAAPKYSAWSPPVNLGPVVNSPYDDVLGAFSKDNLSLYFSSTRPGGVGLYDMWVSERPSEDAPWGPPVNLGPVVNSTDNDAGPTLSRDGHWLFFQSMRPGTIGGYDLMAAWRPNVHDNFSWQAPVYLGAVINTPFLDAGPSFFEGDEQVPPQLFFGSTRPGLGGYDLWVSEFNADGTPGPPMLIPELSSPSPDQRPAISHTGKEIFFHSQRPGGAGAGDLWTSTRATLSSAWATPTPVTELNTVWFDVQASLSSDDRTMIFNSDRPGGSGLMDLYVTTRSK